MIPRSLTVAAALEEVADAQPDAIAISTFEREVSARELERRSAAVAAALLARPVAAGSSVALIAAGIDYVVAYFGIVRAGCRAVPIEPRFRGEQLRAIVASTGCRAGVVDGEGREALAALAAGIDLLDVAALVAAPAPAHALPTVAEGAELCVLFSSGSTGVPKGVVLSQRAGVERAKLMARVYGPGKRHLVFTPLAYAYGLIDGILCPILHGGRTLLLGSYSPPRFKEMVARFQPEIVLGVPFLYKHLGSMGANLLAGLDSASRCLYYTTGEPLPRATMNAFQARYGEPIRQNYGLSEVSALAADLHDAPPKPSRVGKVVPGVAIRIVEQRDGRFVDVEMGEVWVKRSPRFMAGYVSGTEAEGGKMAEDCYRTGDIGRVDEEGYLELFGRNDDFVTVGGVRIHPAEVENVLLTVAGVLEAAFVVERDLETGDTGTRAYVVIDPASGVTAAALDAKLRAELPPSRWPQEIAISAGLPRTDTGKLVRRRLAERKDERLVASAKVEVAARAGQGGGRLLDVSRNGCALLLEGMLSVGVGDEVQVALAAGGEPIAGTCRASSSEADGQRVAVAFADGAAESRAAIEALIARRSS